MAALPSVLLLDKWTDSSATEAKRIP
jgi:hypothetical protein